MIYSIRVKRPTVSEHREDILDYQHNLDCFFSERVQKVKPILAQCSISLPP